MRRRMTRRGWWENTRYCEWKYLCPCVCYVTPGSFSCTFCLQGSFLVYPVDPGDDEEEDVRCQITNGIPRNSPIKVLVRVYIVKVCELAACFVLLPRLVKHFIKSTLHYCCIQRPSDINLSAPCWVHICLNPVDQCFVFYSFFYCLRLLPAGL